MVYKRSEYGHQFKISSLIKNVPVYKQNVNYRHQRRELECAHTPISWDFELTESEESDEKLSPDADVDKLPFKDIQISEEKEEYNDDAADKDVDTVEREKKEAQEKDKNKVQKGDSEKDDVEITKQNEDLKKAARMKLKQYVSQKNKDEETVKDEKAMPVNKSNSKCN